MNRVFANCPGYRGSIPGLVIPKTQKMIPEDALLNTQHYKIRNKCKVEQSGEWSSALPYTWAWLLLKTESILLISMYVSVYYRKWHTKFCGLDFYRVFFCRRIRCRNCDCMQLKNIPKTLKSEFWYFGLFSVIFENVGPPKLLSAELILCRRIF